MSEIKIPWPEWKEIRKIGKGGYGTVYEISYTDKFGVEERAALKVIRFPQDETENRTLLAEGYDKDSITAYNRERLDKVINEYAMMMQMKGHRNIVRCDACEAVPHEDGMGWDVYIRMELLTSLHTKLEKGKLLETEVIKLGKDLCQALMLCEKKKIVHRDIKPENIFVNEYGDYKLGDFGISRTMERTTNATRTGSPRFMAPEVYKDQKYGSTVDIYSLGLVMYWLLNNYRMPFLPIDRPPTLSEKEEALQRRMAGEEALPAPARGSEELKKAVLKACSYDASNRYATAEEFYNGLTLIDAVEEVKENIATDGHIPETDETEAVVWKKEKESGSDTERKEDSLESEMDITMSVFNNGRNPKSTKTDDLLKEEKTNSISKSGRRTILAVVSVLAVLLVIGILVVKYGGILHSNSNPLTALSGDYIELGQILISQEYDEVWVNEYRKYVGEEAEEEANDYKLIFEGNVYGEEEIKRIENGEHFRLFTSFKDGMTQLRIDGEAGTISGIDNTGKTIFKHKYTLLEQSGNEGSQDITADIYITDDDAGNYKYFAIGNIGFSDTCNMICFRYGDNLDAIRKFNTGEYAFWLPYGVSNDYTDQDIKNFIKQTVQDNN